MMIYVDLMIWMMIFAFQVIFWGMLSFSRVLKEPTWTISPSMWNLQCYVRKKWSHGGIPQQNHPENIRKHLVMTNIAMENHHFYIIGKPSINGPFSMAMLNNQRVTSNFPKHTHLENHNPSTICRSWSPTETIYLFIFHIYVRKKKTNGSNQWSTLPAVCRPPHGVRPLKWDQLWKI